MFEVLDEGSVVRGARNQSLFRAINEELRRAADHSVTITVACECADLDCVEAVEIELDEYRRIRSTATHFVVRSGHVYPELERVAAERRAFVIVEKLGEAAKAATALARPHPSV